MLTSVLVRNWFRTEKLEKTAEAFSKDLHSWLEANYDVEVAANFPWDLFNTEDANGAVGTETDGSASATLRTVLEEASVLVEKAATESSSPSSTGSTTDGDFKRGANSDVERRVTSLVWDLLNNESVVQAAFAATGAESQKKSLKRKASEAEAGPSALSAPLPPSFAGTAKRWRKDKHEPLQKLFLEGAAASSDSSSSSANNNKLSLVVEVRNFIERQVVKSLERRETAGKKEKTTVVAAEKEEDEGPEWQPKAEFLPAKKAKKSDEPKPDAIEVLDVSFAMCLKKRLQAVGASSKLKLRSRPQLAVHVHAYAFS